MVKLLNYVKLKLKIIDDSIIYHFILYLAIGTEPIVEKISDLSLFSLIFNHLFNSSTSMTFSPRPTFVILRHGSCMHVDFSLAFSLKSQYTLAQHKKIKANYLLKGFKQFRE